MNICAIPDVRDAFLELANLYDKEGHVVSAEAVLPSRYPVEDFRLHFREC
jgi:hypothetical protein